MDALCINAQGRLALIHTSTTLDISVLSLLDKISVNVKGEPAYLSSAHFSLAFLVISVAMHSK